MTVSQDWDLMISRLLVTYDPLTTGRWWPGDLRQTWDCDNGAEQCEYGYQLYLMTHKQEILAWTIQSLHCTYYIRWPAIYPRQLELFRPDFDKYLLSLINCNLHSFILVKYFCWLSTRGLAIWVTTLSVSSPRSVPMLTMLSWSMMIPTMIIMMRRLIMMPAILMI